VVTGPPLSTARLGDVIFDLAEANALVGLWDNLRHDLCKKPYHELTEKEKNKLYESEKNSRFNVEKRARCRSEINQLLEKLFG